MLNFTRAGQLDWTKGGNVMLELSVMVFFESHEHLDQWQAGTIQLFGGQSGTNRRKDEFPLHLRQDTQLPPSLLVLPPWG